jgi:hypothetical protein
LFKIAIHWFPCDISMCICIITKLVHALYFSSFSLNLLLMVISTGLKILYSLLYRRYITIFNHILNFLLLSSLSHMWSPLSVTCFHNFTCIVLGLYS